MTPPNPTTPARKEGGELLALAELCEAAIWPDRELDALIGVAFGHFVPRPEKYPGAGTQYVLVEGAMETWPGNAPDSLVPRFTASLDAAMTLAGGWFRLTPNADKWDALGKTGPWSTAATPALALTAACLRARALSPARLQEEDK